MRITRFYTGADAETHFEELEIPLEDRGLVRISGRIAVEDIMVVDNLSKPGEARGFHNAPQRQVVVMLSGTHEVTNAKGESRRWSKGDAFLPDDTTGHGHLTTVIEEPVRYLFIKLPDGFDAGRYRVRST
jgi:gentisate 1,2-dioxygenase